MDLPIIQNLFKELDKAGIDYCRADNGETISDGQKEDPVIGFSLASNAIPQFISVLSGMNFVQVSLPHKKNPFTLARYMAVDEDSGKAVHIDLIENAISETGTQENCPASVTGLSGALRTKVDSFLRRVVTTKAGKDNLAPYGKIVAFMGGDGSGKTSNIQAFAKWFGKYFNVRVIHIGKPPKGPLWYGTLVLLKLRKIALRIRSDNFHESIKHLLIARYRQKAYGKALALRSRGFLVCLDRFPLPGMVRMEAPQIRRLTGGTGIFDCLAKKEEHYHANIRGADELFVLILDPSLAVRRRPEDDPVELDRRHDDILQRNWPPGYAHLIDASQPFDKVVAEIRGLAWQGLQKRTKVLEIIGPAGAGKTSVARRLTDASNCLKTTVSWHDHKWSLVKVGCRRFFHIFDWFLHGVPMGTVKEMIGLEVDLDILKKHKIKHILPCRDIVLEIGPLFKIAKIVLEGKLNNAKLVQDIITNISGVLDTLVWIDAPNDILESRINTRQKQHIVKNQTSESISGFLDDYRNVFARVLDKTGKDFPVVRCDSSQMTTDELAAAIMELL